jgi:phosphoribosylamine--glycine ligase
VVGSGGGSTPRGASARVGVGRRGRRQPGQRGTSRVAAGSHGKDPALRPRWPLALARDGGFDLVVVGPEAPLVAGLVDRLADAGVLAFGPSAAAPSSRGPQAFMKSFAARPWSPTARYKAGRGAGDVDSVVARLRGAPLVKADGSAPARVGGGPVPPRSRGRRSRHARRAGLRCCRKAGRHRGASLRAGGERPCALTDGERFVMLPAAQDHKRVGTATRGRTRWHGRLRADTHRDPGPGARSSGRSWFRRSPAWPPRAGPSAGYSTRA